MESRYAHNDSAMYCAYYFHLDGEVCTIGGFLSTSNHLQDDYVYVKAEAEIVWTMEIRDPIS